MKKLLLILLCLPIIFTSCKKEEVEINNNEYLIFGHFYGMCGGEDCIETFKLTDEKLYEDLNDNYSGTEPFNFVILGDEKYNEAKDLISFFPSQLLNENDITFGCPDCVDQGGLFIGYKKDGELKKWRIDQNKNQVPNYLHNFMDKVNVKIAAINT